MTKKITALLLCVLLILVFTSCSKEDAKETEAASHALLFEQVDAAYDGFDSSTIAAYADLCKAVCEGESEVRMNLGLFNDVMQLFYTSFPLQVFVKDIVKNDKQSGVVLTYTESEESVREKSAGFSEKVNQILRACKKGNTNERAYTIRTYHYVATHISLCDEGDTPTVYDTIMTGKASALTASGMLEYLLRQGGVKAAHVLASDAAGSKWGICSVFFDDSYYYLDPMTEYYANDGEKLCYFGMTDEDAAAEGLSSFQYTDQTQAAVCDNPYFDACRHSTQWELSENDRSLIVTDINAKLVEIAL